MKQYNAPTSYVQETEKVEVEKKKDDTEEQSASAALAEQKKIVDDLDSQITRAEKRFNKTTTKLEEDQDTSDLLLGENNLVQTSSKTGIAT